MAQQPSTYSKSSGARVEGFTAYGWFRVVSSGFRIPGEGILKLGVVYSFVVRCVLGKL